MKERLCNKCKKTIRMQISDEGNYFWSCNCKATRITFSLLSMPFEWRE